MELLSVLSTGSVFYNCVAQAILQVDVKDNCDSEVRAFVDLQNDNIPEAEFELINGVIKLPNVPIDELIQFSIRLVDECGNSGTYGPFTTTISDNIPPVAICEGRRSVSLGLDCEVIVPATAFDDGSYDNCGSVSFSVARMDAIGEEVFSEGFNTSFFEGDEDFFEPNISFSKADLAGLCEGVVKVVFRVKDGNGNLNYCMTEVELQDKIAPILVSQNLTILCDAPAADDFISAATSSQSSQAIEALLNTAGAFSDASGAAYIAMETDNCDNATFVVDAVNTRQFDATCRRGVIRVSYQAVDACGNVSLPGTATVTFTGNSDWIMNFPTDAEVFCEGTSGVPSAATLDDILTNFGCDNWGLEVADELFSSEGNACSQIVRTYHLINFCTWNPSNTEIAVIERPKDLILDPLYTVALRYRDTDHNGINDIDDGNEDGDLQGYPTPNEPVYVYKSVADRVNVFQPIRIPFTSTQIERINDLNEAIAFDPYDVTGLTFDADFVVLDRLDVAYQNIPVYPAISQFSGVTAHYVSAQSYGNILYRQILRINDVTAPTIEVTANGPFCDINATDCTAPVSVKFKVVESCSQTIGLTYELVAFAGTVDELVLTTDPFGGITAIDNEYTIAGQYPVGKHLLQIRAVDGCTNAVRMDIPFEVTDCTAPVISCLYGLAIDLMPTGSVTIQATDFESSSTDNCSDVRLTFADPSIHPDSTTRLLSCENGELGFVVVDIWAQDASGNTAYCSTFINVQNNPQNNTMPDQCPTPGAMIAGAINTIAGDKVADVNLTLSGSRSDKQQTSDAGEYQFAGLATSYDYTITPQRDDNPLNGVSTLDLVLLSKHILGVELLATPYQLIAGDVNNSGSITTFDIVALRKLILAIDTEFTNNTSWRFIPKDYEFLNPIYPFGEDYPEVMNFNDLDANHLAADFIAIKIGDLNASAIVNSSTQLENRVASTPWHFQTADATLETGDFYTAYFETDGSDLEGFQFTMQFQGVEVVQVLPAELGLEHFGVFEDALTVSWNGQASSNSMFGLVLRANTAVSLSEAVIISSDRTQAEAYSRAGMVQPVAINFASTSPVLLQNEPNPFEDETVIGFVLPTTDYATLTLYDLSGKMVQEFTGTFAAGYHEVIVRSDALPLGVLYYTLATSDFVGTRKMVLVK
ncbi:MAG: hypothetical protein HC892_09570 [Saprospiraceae bacterium]|nr:hypothetical protein [Saprospiraceae bacterium]